MTHNLSDEMKMIKGSRIVPAKIAKPRLGHCYRRNRLFKSLDKHHHKPAVWISGPAGTGKTMLTASFLEDKKMSCLWYQIDARDGDPATLFYYLGMAANDHFVDQPINLPLLTPQNMLGISDFTRNYFESLYQHFRSPFVIVFDNYQEVSEDAPFHNIIHDALDLIPEQGRLILISRSEPPSELNHPKRSHDMHVLEWKDLKLNMDEVQALALEVQGVPLGESEAAALHNATMGWAAGVVLLLVRSRDDSKPIDFKSLSAPDTVFHYFAVEILANLDENMRNFLIKSAFMPQLNAKMAASLTGNKQAGDILAYLARKNYFTLERSGGQSNSYQYHPLFKAFLMNHAENTLSSEELKELMHGASSLLIESRQYDEAVDLLRSAGSWDRLAQLIASQAHDLIAQGRLGTLENWLRSLPKEMLVQNPWLHYWLGVCRLPFAPQEGQGYFEASYSKFKQSREVTGSILAWSGIADSIVYQQMDYKRLDHWLKELDHLKAEMHKSLPREIETRLNHSILYSLIWRQPRNPQLEFWAERATHLLKTDTDVNLRIELGGSLCIYHSYMGDYEKYEKISVIMKIMIQSPHAMPASTIQSQMLTAFSDWYWGNHAQALMHIKESQETANRSGIHLWDSLNWGVRIYIALCRNDWKSADNFLEKLGDLVANAPLNMDTAHYYFLMSWREILHEKPESSLKFAKKGLEIAKMVGATIPQYCCYYGLAHALFANDRVEEAMVSLNESSKIFDTGKCLWMKHSIFIARAYFMFKTGNTASGLDHLNQALTLGNKNGLSQTFWWQPRIMTYLYHQALKNNIQVDFVRSMIDKYNLKPDPDTVDSDMWPWPIRISTLGRFKVVAREKSLTPKNTRKSKPLALLKAIIAFGGRQVSEEALLDALWPEAEGDAAHVSFTTTLHRLRKMIGHENAIKLQGHRVSLDPHQCWVDTWGLESLTAKTEELSQKSEISEAVLRSLADQILKLYPGHFLHEDHSLWTFGPRERFRNQALRLVQMAGVAFEKEEKWNQAVTIYEYGLKIDPLVEAFYQGLMRCHQQMNRPDDAMNAYERCHETLGKVLSVRPSSATEAIHKKLPCSYNSCPM